MKSWLLDFYEFLVAVVRWWKFLITGSLVIAGIVLYEHVSQPLGAATAGKLFGFGFVVVAIFLAWRQERLRVRALDPFPLAPGVDV